MSASTDSRALDGRTVLVPRAEDASRADSIAAALREAGAAVVSAALTRTVSGDVEGLARSVEALARGDYRWLVLTSARTVAALLGASPGTELFGCARRRGTQIAAVGEATAGAVTRAGGRVDAIGGGSARALLALPALADGPGSPDNSHSAESGSPSNEANLLLPCSRRATPALEDGLTAAGWHVTCVEAYDHVPVDPAGLPDGLASLWQHGGIDAVVITSGSTARAAVTLWGHPSPAVRIVAIGASTAQAAIHCGLTVDGIADAATPRALCDAVVRTCVPDAVHPSMSCPREEHHQ